MAMGHDGCNDPYAMDATLPAMGFGSFWMLWTTALEQAYVDVANCCGEREPEASFEHGVPLGSEVNKGLQAPPHYQN
eukprot:7632793-Alexandrium_andersonii.AAC.1